MARTTKARAGGSTARFIVRPLFAALVASGVVMPHAAHSATIPVTTGGDAGGALTCTLRQAVTSLNAGSTAGTNCVAGGSFGDTDTVDLTGQLGTITLGGTQIEVNVSTTFNGPGAGLLALSGNDVSRVFAVGGKTEATFNALTIRNGRALAPGGCIGGPALIFLNNSVVSGCSSLQDPEETGYLGGVGGGVAGFAVALVNSTVSGNTARFGGGGVFGKYVTLYASVVANNVVSGVTCNLDEVESEKYCAVAIFGGGGILTGAAQLVESTVSGNTVNASRFIDEGDPGNPTDGTDAMVGFGGGITQIASKYDVYGGGGGGAQIDLKRSVFGTKDAATRVETRKMAKAAFKASNEKFRSKAAAAAFAKSGMRTKADGFGERVLAVYASTLSGNRVTGNKSAPSKYFGGGAFVYSKYGNAEFANSTISGNSLDPAGQSRAGSALFADSAELTSSTVTGNAGGPAVVFKYSPPDMVQAAGRSAKRGALAAKLKARVETMRNASRTKAGGVNKAVGPPVMDSTIIGGNSGGVNLDCFECTIGGANNLIQSRSATTTVPPDTIQGLNPLLFPLANNGGVIAGAPGHILTGPNRTHLLFTTSPAVNAGNDLGGFPFDQRGTPFVRVTGGQADIGAIEGAAPPPNPGTHGADPANAIPTLGPWLLALLSAMLGALGLARRRRSP